MVISSLTGHVAVIKSKRVVSIQKISDLDDWNPQYILQVSWD